MCWGGASVGCLCRGLPRHANYAESVELCVVVWPLAEQLCKSLFSKPFRMLLNGTQLYSIDWAVVTVDCLIYCLDGKHKADGKTKLTRNVVTWRFSDRASWIDYILITNFVHWLLFIHKILISSTCFEPQVLIFRRIQLYKCSVWYRHSLWEFLVACRYTAWVRTDCRGKVVGRAS